jgi:hypothetical protein
MLRIMPVINVLLFCIAWVNILEARNKQKVVFIDPLQHEYYNDRLFELNKSLWGKARQRFAQANILLTTDLKYLNDKLDCYVVFNAPASAHAQRMMQSKSVKKILMAWEPPTVSPQNYHSNVWRQFDRVMTYNGSYVKNSKFKKFNYCFSLSAPQKYHAMEDRKLCTLIASNKQGAAQNSIYPLRAQIVDYFIQKATHDFDLWGHGWQISPVYKGIVDDKLACMAKYKYAFCFENSCENDYVTEKIFDAFSAGCVPIYLGAPNIDQYIPTSCFVDYRDFASLDELYTYLKNMSVTEYEEYLYSARTYLESPQARIFSYDYFIERLLATVKEVLVK